MRFLIGLDDTDNPTASSTGLLAQRLEYNYKKMDWDDWTRSPGTNSCSVRKFRIPLTIQRFA